MATIASQILDRAENTCDMRRSSIGIAGLESTQLLTVLNSAVKEYFSSFEKSGEPPTLLKKEIGYTLVSDTALAAATDLGATDFTVDDSSELGTSGALAIWDNDRPDYLEFTGNDLSTAISGVTGLSFAHEENDVVSLLYALPSTFDSIRSEEGYEDGISVDGFPYFFTSGSPIGNKYGIYDNGTAKYLHFPEGVTGDVFLRYNAVPTVINAETDTVDIPTKDEDYAYWYVVKYLALKLERPELYQEASSEMFKILNSAHIRRNIGKRPRVRGSSRSYGYSRSQIFDV